MEERESDGKSCRGKTCRNYIEPTRSIWKDIKEERCKEGIVNDSTNPSHPASIMLSLRGEKGRGDGMGGRKDEDGGRVCEGRYGMRRKGGSNKRANVIGSDFEAHYRLPRLERGFEKRRVIEEREIRQGYKWAVRGRNKERNGIYSIQNEKREKMIIAMKRRMRNGEGNEEEREGNGNREEEGGRKKERGKESSCHQRKKQRG